MGLLRFLTTVISDEPSIIEYEVSRSTDGYHKFSLDKLEKEFCTTIVDSGFARRTVYKYKFIDKDPFGFMYELSEDDWGKTEWCVKDGVVLERDMYDHAKSLKLTNTNRVQQKIEYLKSRTQWFKIQGEARYFILSNHPEIQEIFETKREIREDFEKIKNGYVKAENFLKQLGIEIDRSKGTSILKWNYTRNLTEDEGREFDIIIKNEEFEKRFGIDRNQFENITEISLIFEKWLKKL